jgi:hypothetical protein
MAAGFECRVPPMTDESAGCSLMVTDNTSLGPLVLVVGDPDGPLVPAVRRLVCEGEIDIATCADVYAAVVRIAQAAGRRLLVVGMMQDLARENSAFFPMAAARTIRCCCVLDRAASSAREELLGALKAGVTILGDVQDVRGVLKEWQGTPPAADAGSGARGTASAGRRTRAAEEEFYEEFRATAAELDALLG